MLKCRAALFAKAPSKAKVASAAGRGASRKSAFDSPGGSLRILVADDNSENRSIAIRQLDKLGYTADAVTNGLEALEAAARLSYDVVLMDCAMPDMDGYEAMRRLQPEARFAERPVIALTAPMAAGRFVATTRFAPRESHPAGSMLRLSIESVWAEVARRARQLARHDIPLEARPQLSDLRHHGTIVKREQWAVACKINGVATVRELAWRNGFALHDTIEWVGELVEAGLCTLLTSEARTMTDRGVAELASDPRAGRAAGAPRRAAHGAQMMVGPPPGGNPASASSPEAVVAGPESGPGPPLPLPRRRPVTRAGIGPGTGARSFSLPQELKEISETPFTPVSADLLQWVLRGLKRMSLLCRSRGIDDKGNHYCR